MSEERARRLAAVFGWTDEEGAAAGAGGSNVSVGGSIASTTSGSGSDGSVSNLGVIPTGPLTSKKKKNKSEAIVCRSCGYPSMSESHVCPECGSRLQNEAFEDRVKSYRQNLIEGKAINEDRSGIIVDVLETLVEAAQKGLPFKSLDENDQAELGMRMKTVLADFVSWKARKDYGLDEH